MKTGDLLLKLKINSSLSWGQVAELLGYKDSKALINISRGVKEMSSPAEKGLHNLIRLIIAYDNKGEFCDSIEECVNLITIENSEFLYRKLNSPLSQKAFP